MEEQDFSMASARLHAKLPAYRRAAERARERVWQALTAAPGTWAIGCSGGKDSTAMLEICAASGWRGPVPLPLLSGLRLGFDLMALRLARRYGFEFACIEAAGDFDAFACVGHFFAMPRTEAEHEAVRWWLRTHKRQIAEH